MDNLLDALHAGTLDLSVAVIATDAPPGARFAEHTHRHGQLIHAIAGVMMVRTADGSWVVPTGRAVWVPGGTVHAIQMADHVRMRTVFVAPEARPTLPAACRVIEVGPLLRELIVAGAALAYGNDDASDRKERLLDLMLDEIEQAPALSLHVPMPRHPALAALCAALLDDPAQSARLDDWARAAHMNARTLARAFKRETGMTHGEWCRHARLLLSLPRLAAGVPILTLALEHGYDSPSAFAAMFRKVLGVAPTGYFRGRR